MRPDLRGPRPAFDGYYIVTFEEIGSVAKVLAKKEHLIYGEKVEAYPADRNLVGDIQANLRNLTGNEQAFKDEFSNLKFIQLPENRFEIVILRKDRLHFGYLKSMETIESLFRNFGPLIKSIDLRNIYVDRINQFQELITKYCSVQNSLLTKLFYHILPRDDDSQEEQPQQSLFSRFLYPAKIEKPLQGLELVFSRLNVLYIYELGHSNVKLLSVCRELTDLIIDDIHDKFISIIQSNPHLKRLRFNSVFYTISPKIFNAIGEYSPKLEELACNSKVNQDDPEYFKNEIIHLGKLHHLKILQFNCINSLPVKNLIDVLVKEKIPIEELILDQVNLDTNTIDSLKNLGKIGKIKKLTIDIVSKDSNDHLVEAISAFHSLNYVYLIDFPEFKSEELEIMDLMKIVDNLKQLKMIDLYTKGSLFVINENTYQRFANLVKKRDNKVPLSFKIHTKFGEFLWCVPKSAVEANRQWLQFIKRIK